MSARDGKHRADRPSAAARPAWRKFVDHAIRRAIQSSQAGLRTLAARYENDKDGGRVAATKFDLRCSDETETASFDNTQQGDGGADRCLPQAHGASTG